MASLQELGLSNDKIEGVDNFDDLAEQRAFAPPPDPGTYRFQLPAAGPLAQAFGTVQSEKGQRIQVDLGGDAPLVIVQSPGKTHDGEPFSTRISNIERKRDRQGLVVASDMDYLLKALGETTRAKTNAAYGQALLKHAGQTFTADVEWSWNCNPRRAARFEGVNEDGTPSGAYETVDDPSSALEGDDAGKRAGCGTRYYQNDVPKVDGKAPLRITCQCGASVRAFANLTRFRK
jgi:hypothetical protein